MSNSDNLDITSGTPLLGTVVASSLAGQERVRSHLCLMLTEEDAVALRAFLDDELRGGKYAGGKVRNMIVEARLTHILPVVKYST